MRQAAAHMRGTRRRLSIWTILMLVGGAVGVLYALGTYGEPVSGFFVGATISGGVAGFEIFYVQRPSGAWLRSLPLWSFIAITTLAWTGIIAFSVRVIPLLLISRLEKYPGGSMGAAFIQDVAFSLMVSVLINVALRLRRLVGGRVLVNFLSGRYRHPFEEDRIFLFLDLIGSTAIAERIGHVRYHAFLRDFIEDLELPVLEHGGEVYQYVGDEVVVTWRMADKRSNARCVACYFAMLDAIGRSRRRYEARFGVAPDFRAGIHCGSVVAGEIGYRRMQIVFVGDVVNTASRMETEARARDCDLVVSGEFLATIDLPADVAARRLGLVRPKGKEASVHLFQLVRRGCA